MFYFVYKNKNLWRSVYLLKSQTKFVLPLCMVEILNLKNNALQLICFFFGGWGQIFSHESQIFKSNVSLPKYFLICVISLDWMEGSKLLRLVTRNRLWPWHVVISLCLIDCTLLYSYSLLYLFMLLLNMTLQSYKLFMVAIHVPTIKKVFLLKCKFLQCWQG